jgi:6-phosphofructokinase
MRYTRDELGEIDFYLSNGGRPLETARRMDKKHPGQRTVEAWEKMVHRVKKHGLEKMLENAIDMEVE